MEPIQSDNFIEVKDLEIAKFTINKSFPDDFVMHVGQLLEWANMQGFEENIIYNVRIKATANLVSSKVNDKIISVICDVLTKKA